MQKKVLKKPFFSKFMESQLSEAAEKAVQGGGPDMVTLKVPSDNDEDHITLKVPSDKDEDDGVTNRLGDMYQTQKYPSDGDDDTPPVKY